MSKFSGCMSKDATQHRRCKVSNDTGSRCECDCEEHGVDYVPYDFKNPLHMILEDIARAHGIITETEEEPETMTDVTKGDDKQSAATAEDEETIEQLEEKRK